MLKEDDLSKTVEYKYKCKDGSYKIIELTAVNLTNHTAISGVLMNYHDITERKTFENTIKESEKRWKRAIADSPVPIMIHDENDNVLQLSAGWTKYSGYTIEDIPIIGDWTEKAYGERTGLKKEYIDNLFLIAHTINNGEWVVTAKDGSKRIWDFQTTPLGKDNSGKRILHSMAIDITENKRAENALKESKIRYDLAMQAAKDGIYDWDLLTNQIYYSPGWKNILGYEEKELVNDFSVWEQLTHPADVQKSWKMLREVISKTRDRFEMEFRMKHKDGHWVDILSRARAVFDDKGTAVRVVGTHVDISERKKVEAELEQHRNHLEELVETRTRELELINKKLKDEIEKEREIEKMLQASLEKEKELGELKSRFITTVSHEFRTPLTTILSSVELLQRYGRKWDENKYAGHIDKVVSSIDDLTSLLEDILLISKTDAGKIDFNPVNIRLDLYCEGIIKEMKPLLYENQKLIYEYEANKTQFRIDEKMMRMILINLLSNAIKYSPYGGVVKLSVTQDENLKITISDEGIGISEKDQYKIFDSFYRTEEAADFSGTGLGLAIVKRSVELHKGRISVESKKGAGSKFIVEIPLEI